MKTDAGGRPAEPARKPRSPGITPPERRFGGIPVSPGIVVAPIFDLTETPAEAPRRAIGPALVEAERLRLNEAATFSRKQVGKLKTRLSVLPEEAKEELEPLLDAYILMLGNSRLLRNARKRIGEELLSAETAVADEAEAIASAILA
ncbi:MAG TPA: phosphoenolpyruvate-utilizing N-terminal domain-containing protein, partial [Roseococcus sp.]|nr:phosphoenolpyruvate-utilizing N-terminal domain-containing protein [Roseococcus sp.]